MTGAGILVRLALRRDRVRLPVWIVAIVGMMAASLRATHDLYPDPAELRELASGIGANPAAIAFYGPAYELDTIGGITLWKPGGVLYVIVALMAVLTVVRHTRAEEEAGRTELVGAGVVGRWAPLLAAVVVAAGAVLALGVLMALSMIGLDLPASGALAASAGFVLVGWMFTGVAAVTAQLVESARAASGLAGAVLGATYLVRAAGDALGTDGASTWLSWCSPIGWVQQLHAFGQPRWWVLALPVLLTAVLGVAAVALNGRRDLGAGLVPPRPGPSAGSLTGPFALAWRLQRGTLLGWTAGLAVVGAVLGGVAAGVAELAGDNARMVDLIEALGGAKSLIDGYLATAVGISGLAVSGYTVQAMLRLRTEESRAELLLSTPLGRLRWAASHLVVAVLGTAVVLAVFGLVAGLVHGLRTSDVGGQVPRLLGAALVQLPAALVLAGITVALIGLVPRLATASWAVLGAFVLLGQLGASLGLAQWALDLSPYTHTPRLPAAPVDATALAWLVALAVGLTVAGLAGLRRRDLT